MFDEILLSIGLTSEQITLYNALLDKGQQGASDLAKNSKLQRTYVYLVARQLVQLGLAQEQKKGRATTFTPLSPDRLMDLAEANKQKALMAQSNLEGVLATLKGKYTASETRPVVTYYEGQAGLRKVFKNIYAAKSEPVWGCVDLKAANQAIKEYIPQELIPLRVQNQVLAKSFIADSPEAREAAQKDAEALRESRLLNKDSYPLPAEIDVYEDKVAMLSFAKGEFVGIIIQNQEIATSLKSIFKLAFEKSV